MSRKTTSTANQSNQQAQESLCHAMLQAIPLNVMCCDLDCKITFANPASIKTLRAIENLLPVKADEVLGSSIDIFHKEPERQRALLKNPQNLPFTTKIKVGPEDLELNLAAIHDGQGTYCGAMVSWSVITEKLKLERMIEEQQAAQKALAEKLQKDAKEILHFVEMIAAGDVVTIPTINDGVMSQIATAISTMNANLREIIKQLEVAAEQITEGPGSVASGAVNLAESAQQNAATVEQMSASIVELTASIQNISENAQAADHISHQTVSHADEGSKTVHSSMEAIELINKSFEQISDIAKVISEIASQTNLLALNAAIEAARAGEHGLGFAVVADEVRKLAERSSEATKEISALIKESNQRVQQGTKLSQQTNDALSMIIQGVEGTANALSQIAAATEQQAATSDEVNRGIQHVAEGTEVNSAAAEEMSASAEQLAAQAQALKDVIGRFKI